MGNILTARSKNTNVVKLYSLFKKEESEQLCYYQVYMRLWTYVKLIGLILSLPSLASAHISMTVSCLPSSSGVQRYLTKVSLGASNAGRFDCQAQVSHRYLDAHVRGGYQFLMQNYRPGDKICIFGECIASVFVIVLSLTLMAPQASLGAHTQPEPLPECCTRQVLYRHLSAGRAGASY